MKQVFIRKANARDIKHVAERLTPADRTEVTALTGLEPEAVLPMGLYEGREVLVAGLADEPDNPMLVYGIDPSGYDGIGMPWLLCTPGVAEHPVEFVRCLRSEWKRFHQTYPVLTNWTLADNSAHISMLRWLGCIFPRKANLGPDSTPFLEFASVA